MRIGTRILAGYGFTLLIFGGVSIVAYRGTTALLTTADLVTHTHKVKESINKVQGALKDSETGQRGFLLTGAERYLAPYETTAKLIPGLIQDLRELTVDNPGQQKRVAALDAFAAIKLSELAKTIAIRRRSGERAALQEVLTDKGKNAMDEIRRVVDEMNGEEDKLLRQRDQLSKTTAHNAMSAMVFGGLLVFVVLSIAGTLIQRSITRPLRDFIQFASRVGAGDLTRQAQITRDDEIGELAQSLNQMVAGLKDVAGQTRLATESLNTVAAEVLVSTRQQAASTAEQAAAVQQTSTSMEEVTQSAEQISQRAKEVVASAEATFVAGRVGRQEVENTIRTMENIREQAEAVAENIVSLSGKTQAVAAIISTVNDVAEQSHLLALNAAIEAAAAGEHGRSFSVIASEVKNLADQSREATVQVRSILGDIQKGINTSVMLTEEAVKRVDAGKQQAGVTERTTREMGEGIQQSVQAFQQIVAGTNQQQIGFTQVMQALRDITQASQQTASSTGQLEKLALSVTTLAQQLQKTVERYQI